MKNTMEKMNGKILSNRRIIFIISVLSAFAMTLDMNVSDAPESGITNSLYLGIYKMIEKISLDLKDKGFVTTILVISFFAVYYVVWVQKPRNAVRYTKGLSFVLAVLYTFGVAFAYGNSLSVLYTSSIRLLKTVILILGIWMIYLTAINVLYDLLHGDRDIKNSRGKMFAFYAKHPLATGWVIIMGNWLLHLLLRYPGTMSYDNWRQMSYYFGYCTYTTAQPIFHTWLFSSFIDIALKIGSANLGLFAFVIFQSLIMSFVLSYSLVLMKKWNAPRWLRLLSMAIYCITPYYAGYASFPIKDFLYTAFFLLFLLYLMEWIRNTEEFWMGRFRKVGWICAVSLFILCRKNGIYIYIPVICLMGILELRKFHSKDIRKQMTGKLAVNLLCLCLPLLVVGVTEKIITVSYHVEKDTLKEMLSLPFQQTARYVRDHGDEVTEEEKAIIAEVLDYDKIPKVYMELTADPVKTTYHADSSEELISYFEVWFKQFFKHPLCYFEATWNQNYYLFAPNVDNIVYNKDCNIGEEIMVDIGLLDQINFEVPGWMHGICTVMVSYYSFFTRLPILGMFNNVAFYIILLFTVAIFMLADKCRKEWVIMIPLLLSFLIIIAAPQIQNQPRYAFPIIYAMPTVVAFYKSAVAIEKDTTDTDPKGVTCGNL